jgi:hypothetical protein
MSADRSLSSGVYRVLFDLPKLEGPQQSAGWLYGSAAFHLEEALKNIPYSQAIIVAEALHSYADKVEHAREEQS